MEGVRGWRPVLIQAPPTRQRARWTHVAQAMQRSDSTPVHVPFGILECLQTLAAETRPGALTPDPEQKPGRVAQLGVHVRAGIQWPGKSEVLRRRVCEVAWG